MKKIIILSLSIFLVGFCNAQNKLYQQKSISTNSVNKNVSSVPIQKASPSNTSTRDKFVMKVNWQNGIYKKDNKLSDGTSITQTFSVNPKIVKEYINKPTPNDIKRTERNVSEAEPAKVANGWEKCSNKEVRITASNIANLSVDNSAQVANIVPGYMYKFEDYINGNWNQIDAHRCPITLITSVNNTQGDPSIKVDEPSRGNINNAKNTLFARSTTEASKTAQEGFQYNCYEIESQADLAVKLGVSGYGWGVSAAALMSSKKSNHHRYLLIDFTKSMFSISCAPGENGVIEPAFATEDMMYISNVSYGVRVIACAEIESYENETNAQISAKVNYGVAGGQADFDYFSKNTSLKSTIHFYVVGGQSNQVETVYSFDALKAVCSNISKTSNYQNVVPIKYQMKNLNNDLVICNSATDYFNTQSCTYEKDPDNPKDRSISVAISGIAKTDITETDLEIYGQVWAQVFGADGKEIFPVNKRDRLFSLEQNQHLTAANFNGLREHVPNIEAQFNIPGYATNGAKVVIYYWLMDYDSGSGDDFLSMQHGYKKKYNRNNIEYYVQELTINWNATPSEPQVKAATFTDSDGESSITVTSKIDL